MKPFISRVKVKIKKEGEVILVRKLSRSQWEYLSKLEANFLE